MIFDEQKRFASSSCEIKNEIGAAEHEVVLPHYSQSMSRVLSFRRRSIAARVSLLAFDGEMTIGSGAYRSDLELRARVFLAELPEEIGTAWVCGPMIVTDRQLELLGVKLSPDARPATQDSSEPLN